jgi:hypothetical protein
MKRTALILLTAIYLISCVGMGISRLYCCGKLISISVIYGGADSNGKKETKKGNCCKNEKQSFKVKDSHFSAASFSLNHPLPAIIQSFNSPDQGLLANNLYTKIVYKGNAPPGHPDTPVYTLNCAYRI